MQNSELEIEELSSKKEKVDKESAISTISKNMKKLSQMPSNIDKGGNDHSGPFEMANDRDFRKSQVSNLTSNISRDISQINKELTPGGH
jgi:hypothetical protein